MTASQPDGPMSRNDVRVHMLTDDEYQAAVRTTLARRGITYDELAAQAAQGRFSPPALGGLWTLIRGTVGDNGRQPA